MEIIQLDNLTLETFDKDNYDHVIFLKDIIKDESIKKWLHGIPNGLLYSQNNGIFNRTFLVSDNKELIGFINIGV